MITYQYFSEVDFFFKKYWKEHGEITTDQVSIPVVEKEEMIPTESVIELLFSNNYIYSEYNYLFKEKELKDHSKHIHERLFVSKPGIKSYISDSTEGTVNIFSIDTNDILLLDLLLQYRKGVTPDLSITDSSSFSTKLSQLIYNYLNLMVNSDFSELNNIETITTEGNYLENLFEMYVINESHKTIRNWAYIVDSGLVELRPVRDVFIMSTKEIEEKQFNGSDSFFYDSDLSVYLNSKKLNNNYDYNVLIDGTSDFRISIDWNDTGLNVKENDIMVLDYYSVLDGTEEETEKPYDNKLEW